MINKEEVKMGFWGSGLYANDTTCDVRDSYIKLLQDGYSNEDAYKAIMEDYEELIGDIDEPLFWFALAETQWRLGRLLPEVKEKALEWIEKGGGLEYWDDSKSGGAGWKKTLGKLREKLDSPMPKEKKVRKPRVVDMNLWNINDVYAYQFHEGSIYGHDFDGKYVLIQKIGESIDKFSGKPSMRIHIIDKIFDYLPDLSDMKDKRILPLDFPLRTKLSDGFIRMSALILMTKKTEYPEKYLTYIGNIQGPANHNDIECYLEWHNIERWLPDFYKKWKELKYETVEEGVYKYNQP